MILYFEDEGHISFDFDCQEYAEKVINEVLTEEKCLFDVEISLFLVTGEQIQQINLDNRGIDKETDVLSFPGLNYEAPGDFQISEEEIQGSMDPETNKLVFGDIVISSEKVLEQAQSYGHSSKREFCFLVAHSMLHLCGYDHMEEDEAKIMESKQEHILTQLGITRD